jgi:hypothetical protein
MLIKVIDLGKMVAASGSAEYEGFINTAFTVPANFYNSIVCNQIYLAVMAFPQEGTIF